MSCRPARFSELHILDGPSKRAVLRPSSRFRVSTAFFLVLPVFRFARASSASAVPCLTIRHGGDDTRGMVGPQVPPHNRDSGHAGTVAPATVVPSGRTST
ncbi:MAG: hypothetical protein VB138_05015 [Burkholderia sp.]